MKKFLLFIFLFHSIFIFNKIEAINYKKIGYGYCTALTGSIALACFFTGIQNSLKEEDELNKLMINLEFLFGTGISAALCLYCYKKFKAI